MIDITSEKEIVIAKIKLPVVKTNKCIAVFRYQCDCEAHAEIIANVLREKFHDAVVSTRKNEYLQGYRDGRGHRGKKDWFSVNL